VAKILICEPHDDISALLELVVRRLGHEPVTYSEGDSVLGIGAAVIEPGDPNGLRLAQELNEHDVPVLFTSIYPADDGVLDLQPAAYLIKPFPLYALERALCDALVTASSPLRTV
jgi:DNA-binding response OmpR family regulator